MEITEEKVLEAIFSVLNPGSRMDKFELWDSVIKAMGATTQQEQTDIRVYINYIMQRLKLDPKSGISSYETTVYTRGTF